MLAHEVLETYGLLLSRPLAIEGPLILQPQPIPCHALDPLTVKVWNGVIRSRACGIHPVLPYTLVEAFFLDVEGRELPPVEDAPDTIPEDWAEQPADEHGGEDSDARGDYGVGGDEFEEVVGLRGVGGKESHGRCGGGDGGEDGGRERVPTTGGAEGKEGVPV